MPGQRPSVRGPSAAVRRPEPPLRYRWDRISAVAATIVLLLIWVRLTTAESAAAHAAPARSVTATAPVPSSSISATSTPRTRPTIPAVAPANIPAPRACGDAGLKHNLHENLAPAGSARTVALTFDDGPSPYTGDVLNVLAAQNVKATFFVIGSQAKVLPSMVTAEAQAGHEVGNHSWTHHTPAAARGWPPSAAVQEIDRTNSLLTSLTGQRPCLFRPPGGIVKGIEQQVRSRDMAVTLWSVDTEDWLYEKHDDHAKAVSEIVAAARAGLTQQHPIVLMHDGGGNRSATVEALPQVIAEYRAAGYTFVAVGGA